MPKIVGVEHHRSRSEQALKEGEVDRRVRSNLQRVTPDQFLGGQGGAWEVAFRTGHRILDPWSSADQPRLAAALQSTLEASGLAEALKLQHLDFVGGHFTRASIRLELKAPSTVDDRELYRRFSAAWPHEQLPIPPVLFVLPMPEDGALSGKGQPFGDDPLRRVFHAQKNGYVEVNASALRPPETARLKAWAGEVLPGGQRQPAPRQLLALLGSSTDLATASGRATLQAQKDLLLYSPFWNQSLDLLAERFPARQLDRSMFLYNGHPTFSMAAMLPTLKAFGVSKTNVWLSQHSGTAEATEIIKIQKPTAAFAERNFGLSLETGQIPPSQTIADLLNQRMRIPQDSWDTHHLIVDKMGPWLKSLKGVLPRQVVNGGVRGIIHNRDDLDAIAGVEAHLWGVDLANSQVKKLEATFIGEQFALMGAREVRAKGWGRIADVPVIINGFGLLGEEAAHALVRLGMSPANIQVRDLDPGALARAQAAGFQVEPKSHDRALVINATPGAGIRPDNLASFGRDLIAMSMTSGGKGVDLKGLLYQAEVQEVPVERRSQKPIRDLDLKRGKVQVRVIAEGWPPNLVDEMWADRYHVTCLGVSTATLLAAELKQPGIVPFDPVLDQGLIDIAKRTGLLAKRPLDARPGEDPALLLADLQSFSP